jgi:hypothetical protein
MQKQTKQISSIGDIGLTKADTTLFFNKQSVPATVVDEKGNLICFYAKQVMEEHSINDTKENQLLDSVNAVRSSIEPHRAADFKPQCYWYFFSPLYFGESPVACVTSSQWQMAQAKLFQYTHLNECLVRSLMQRLRDILEVSC